MARQNYSQYTTHRLHVVSPQRKTKTTDEWKNIKFKVSHFLGEKHPLKFIRVDFRQFRDTTNTTAAHALFSSNAR